MNENGKSISELESDLFKEYIKTLKVKLKMK